MAESLDIEVNKQSRKDNPVSLRDTSMPSRNAERNFSSDKKTKNLNPDKPSLSNSSLPRVEIDQEKLNPAKQLSEERRERDNIRASLNTAINPKTKITLTEASEKLTDLAKKSASLRESEIDANKISEIVSVLAIEKNNITNKDVQDLFREFQVAHFESRQKLLAGKIAELGIEQAKNVKLNSDNSPNTSEQINTLINQFSDVFNKDIKVNNRLQSTDIKEIFNKNYKQEISRIEKTEQAKLLRHVDSIARTQAKRYFDHERGSKIPNSIIEHQLDVLVKRYPGSIPNDPKLREQLKTKIAKQYENSYNKAYSKEVDKLSLPLRVYYRSKSWAISKVDDIKLFAKNSATKISKVMEGISAIGDAIDESIVNVAKAVGSVVMAVPEALYNAGTKTVSAAISVVTYPVKKVYSIGKALYNFDYSTLPGKISNAWEGVKSAGSAILSIGGSLIKGTVNLGLSALKLGGSLIASATIKVWDSLTIDNLKKVANFGLSCITAPFKVAYWLAQPENMLKVAKGIWTGACMVGSAIKTVASGIKNGVIAVYNACTLENAKAIWNGVSFVAGKVLSAVTNPDNWVKAIELGGKALAASINFTATVIRDPKAAFEQAKNFYKENLDPILRPIGNVLHGIGAELGINDAIFGAFSLIKTPLQLIGNTATTIKNLATNLIAVANGEMSPEEYAQTFKNDVNKLGSNLVNNLKNSTLLVTGGLKFAFEMSGASDFYYMGRALLNGNFAEAAFHGTFAAATVYAWVVALPTGGASILSVQAAKAALKSGVKKSVGSATKLLSGDLGKQTLSRIYKSLDSTVFGKTKSGLDKEVAGEMQFKFLSSKTATEITDESVIKLNKLSDSKVKGDAVLNKDSVAELIEEIALEKGDSLYKEVGLEEATKETTTEFLKTTTKKSKRKLRNELIEMDVPKKEAKKLATKLHKAMKSGKHDDVLFEEICESIKNEVRKHIIEDAKIVSSRFRNLLDNNLDDIVAQNKEINSITSKIDEVSDFNATNKLDEAISDDLASASKELNEKVHSKAKKDGVEPKKLIDDLTEGAEKGYKEGMEKAMARRVAKGVRRALDDFRKKLKKRISGNSKDSESLKAKFKDYSNKGDSNNLKSAHHIPGRDKKLIDKVGSRIEYTVVDGKFVRQEFVLAFDDINWTLTKSTVINKGENPLLSLRKNTKDSTIVA